ncbi:MAG: sigma factor-like helix-turn-helix DNA-binding protein [Verrucomicrobiota bacterium]
MIARFEVLKYRRKMARDRHVFREDVMELLTESVEEQNSIVSNEKYREALAQCLGRLPSKSKELISAAYQDDQTIRELAVQIGKSDTALYKALDRIRKKLHDCIHRRVSLGEAGG